MSNAPDPDESRRPDLRYTPALFLQLSLSCYLIACQARANRDAAKSRGDLPAAKEWQTIVNEAMNGLIP